MCWEKLVVIAVLASAATAGLAGDVSGTLVDATGKPVAKAELTLAPAGAATTLTIEVAKPGAERTYQFHGAKTATDAKGKFALAGLKTGWYAMAVRPADGTGGVPPGQTFIFNVPKAASDLGTVKLRRPAMQVTGRVTLSGKPVSGGSASLFDPACGVTLVSVACDKTGKFAFALPLDAPKGLVIRVSAWSRGKIGSAFVALNKPSGARVDMGEIKLAPDKPLGSVDGKIVDKAYKPVKRPFTVYAFSPDKPLPLRVAPVRSRDGSFGLSLPAGKWRILCTAPGLKPQMRDITIRPKYAHIRLFVKLPATPGKTVSVGWAPQIDGANLPASFLKTFAAPRAVVVVRRDKQAGAPLWLLPHSPISPGKPVTLPAPKGQATIELWQVRQGRAAFRPVRLLAATKAGKDNTIYWDVIARISANMNEKIARGEVSGSQAAAQLEMLGDHYASLAGKANQTFAAALRRASKQIGRLARKE